MVSTWGPGLVSTRGHMGPGPGGFYRRLVPAHGDSMVLQPRARSRHLADLPNKDRIRSRAGERKGHTGPRAGEHDGRMGPRAGGSYAALLPGSGAPTARPTWSRLVRAAGSSSGPPLLRDASSPPK